MSQTRSTMHGSALTNEQVEAAIARERERIARAAFTVSQLLDLLGARAADDPAGWTEARSGFNPARPEPAAAAREALERCERS